jgi:putative endonuclease
MVEHKEGLIPGFTKQYGVHRLVYFEVYSGVRNAIRREKQLKGLAAREENCAHPRH